MREKLRVIKDYVLENLELVLVPIFFLILIFIIQWIWHHFNLPTQDDLITKIQSFFKEYGLWVIFVSSILESMLFIGLYFPGSLVIFLGVAATSGNPILAVKTVATVCAGMLVGYTINFILGKYGWHKVLSKFGLDNEIEKIGKNLREKGMFHSFFLYIMPGFGSLLSTTFGISGFSYIKFLSFTVLMVIFWNSVWGLLVYHFGMPLFKLLTNTFVFFILFCVYFFYMYNKDKDAFKV